MHLAAICAPLVRRVATFGPRCTAAESPGTTGGQRSKRLSMQACYDRAQFSLPGRARATRPHTLLTCVCIRDSPATVTQGPPNRAGRGARAGIPARAPSDPHGESRPLCRAALRMPQPHLAACESKAWHQPAYSAEQSVQRRLTCCATALLSPTHYRTSRARWVAGCIASTS